VTLRLAVDPEAQSEIGEAAGWYEDRLTGLGLEFLAAVDRAFSSIAENPDRFPVWKHGYPFRRYQLERFPYVVFYEVAEDRVLIWAVAHGRRQPGYWVSRRPP
jgi:plasmid stabilization system protein ParE